MIGVTERKKSSQAPCTLDPFHYLNFNLCTCRTYAKQWTGIDRPTGPGGPSAEDLDRCSYLVEITSGHSLFFWRPNVVSCPNMSALFSIFIVQFEKNFDSNKFWKRFMAFGFEIFSWTFKKSVKIIEPIEELCPCKLLVKQAVGL